jgi:hypothetical protein
VHSPGSASVAATRGRSAAACRSPELRPRVRLDFRTPRDQDHRVLETVFLMARALALACRGHHEVVLENLALRQQ